MERVVTHYLIGDKDPDNWTPLYFITQDATGRFYNGFESIELTREDIYQRVSRGEIAQFTSPWPITNGQELFRTPYDDIWLTSGDDPIEDPQRVLLEKGSLPEFVSQYEIIHRRGSLPPRAPATPQLLYIPDDFVNGETYAEFSELVAENLARRVGAEVVVTKGVMAKWELLANIIEQNTVDFCGIAYYLHPGRSFLHGVVQFAVLETFTFYFNPKSRALGHAGNPLFKPELSTEQRLAEGMNSNADLELGILDDTAATREFLTLSREFKWFVQHGPKNCGSIRELKQWIDEEPENRVIVCDHCQADELDEVSEIVTSVRSRVALRYEHSTPRTELGFKVPVPVGFVYPKRDHRWCDAIRRATAAAIDQFILKSTNYDLLSKELNRLKVRLLSKDQLSKSFGIPRRDELDEQPGLQSA